MNERQASVLVIGLKGEPLCSALVQSCQDQALQARWIAPDNLANLNLSMGQDLLIVDGQVIGGVFFHAAPDTCFSTGYLPQDQGFSDAETRAVWLAALNMQSVLAMNRYDADAWFEGFGWPIWRRRLQQAGVALAPARIGGQIENGDCWQVYHSGELRALPSKQIQDYLGIAHTDSQYAHAYLAAGGTILHGPGSSTARAVAALLHQHGIWLAEIFVDQNDQALGINPVPSVHSANSVQLITRKASSKFHEHISRRRH